MCFSNLYLKMVQNTNSLLNDVVLSICADFFEYLNLNHFWYYKITNQGDISFIGSQAEWTELFAAEKFFLIYPQLRPPFCAIPDITLHKDVQDPSLKKIYELSSKFGVRQSLVFNFKTPEGMEEFGFSSSASCEKQTSIFLNKMPLFKFFIRKFKSENRGLLSKLQDRQVNIGSLIGPEFYKDNPPKTFPKNLLLNKMGIEYKRPLSSIESDVVNLMLDGYSASECATQLFRSRRTVEHHIERIKDKLECRSRAELIQKVNLLRELGFLVSEV